MSSGERKTLSKMVLEQRPPATGRVEVRDKESPLVFRLTSAGHRSLCVRARLGTRAGSEQVRITYPKAATIENLSDARQWARRAVDACKAGNDPRAVEQANAEARQRAAARSERLQFENVARNYLDRRVRKEKNNRTADDSRRVFEIYFLPQWEGRLVTEISRGEINDRLDDIFDRKIEHNGRLYGGKVAADRALAQLRACFNWFATKDDKFVSPIVKGMARTTPSKLARDRRLTDDEIRALWGSLPGRGVFGAIVKTLLLTAQRREEVAQMARAEIDAQGVWTIPAARYKTGKSNIVPLPAAASAVIGAQDQVDGSDLVFTTTGKTSFSAFSQGKRELDAAMLDALRMVAAERGNDPEKVTLAPWRLHDLRRAAKTLMARAGVRPDVSERVLGHVIAGVEGVYDHHDYIEEKRIALEKLSALLDRIINGAADNVVALREAAE